MNIDLNRLTSHRLDARLNCIAHWLSLIPFKKGSQTDIALSGRSMKEAYDDQASLKGRKFVPEKAKDIRDLRCQI